MQKIVELKGIEPLTSRMQSARSTPELQPQLIILRETLKTLRFMAVMHANNNALPLPNIPACRTFHISKTISNNTSAH